MLADLGAEVIKIEAPGGDVTRTVPPVVSDVSVYYAQLNAGKRNVCLDLKSPGAAEVITGWPAPATWSWRTSVPACWPASGSTCRPCEQATLG